MEIKNADKWWDEHGVDVLYFFRKGASFEPFSQTQMMVEAIEAASNHKGLCSKSSDCKEVNWNSKRKRKLKSI